MLCKKGKVLRVIPGFRVEVDENCYLMRFLKTEDATDRLHRNVGKGITATSFVITQKSRVSRGIAQLILNTALDGGER